ncbi:MAG TPA: biopolymer transporter ExbD [Capsulimonadaceae bacterium]|jgi:biopolymer transport protein ExbD
MPKVDINIVPLVDVALVLLIIFMVTATFIKNSALRLDLPTASASAAPAPKDDEIVVEIDKNNHMTFNGAPIVAANLTTAFKLQRARGVSGPVTVRGDRSAAYGTIINVMSVARGAGFTQLLVATREGGKSDGQH